MRCEGTTRSVSDVAEAAVFSGLASLVPGFPLGYAGGEPEG